MDKIMPPYSEDDASSARRIVEGFLEAEPEAVQGEGALVVSDVEVDTAEFVNDLDLLADFGADVPAIRLGDEELGDEELVPMALTAVTGLEWYRRPFAEFGGVVRFPMSWPTPPSVNCVRL